MNKSPLKKTLFVFAAILLALFILEILVRVGGLGKSTEESLFTDIYDINYEMLPRAKNPWTVVGDYLNGSGFRGKEISKERAKEVFRIISQGDSTTFGSHVKNEQTYSALLEKNLNEKGIKVEILNAGMPGTYLWQHLLLFERRLMEYSPNLVILYTRPNLRADLLDMRLHMEVKPWETKLKKGLSRLHLYRFLRHKITPLTLERVYTQHVEQWNEPEGILIRPDSPRFEFVKSHTEKDLERYKLLCDKIGAKLVVISVVPRAPFDTAIEEGVLPDGTGWVEYYRRSNVASLATQKAESLGIETIHPETDFFHASFEKDLFVDFVHFTPKGHKLMALVLERELRKRKFLPALCNK